MDKNLLIAQILEQIPDCPHSRASAYLLEFTRRLRNHGTRKITRELRDISNEGYVIHLDSDMRTVSGVYVDGYLASDTMTEEQAVLILHQHGNTAPGTEYAISTEDGDVLTTEAGVVIEYEIGLALKPIS